METKEIKKQINGMIKKYTVVGRTISFIQELFKEGCRFLMSAIKLLLIILKYGSVVFIPWLIFIIYVSFSQKRWAVFWKVVILLITYIVAWSWPLLHSMIRHIKNPFESNNIELVDSESACIAFSNLINAVRKLMIIKGPFWSILLPIEDQNESLRKSISDNVEEKFSTYFNFSSFKESKDFIEKLMDNADRKLFTDALIKKADSQEYYCFDNSFLEYVDAFSSVLAKHHELYMAERSIGESENEKRSE